MKKNEHNNTANVAAAAGTVTLGKTIDYARQNVTPYKHYKDFEEVLKDYHHDVKKGDVVFFSESIGQGKVHPVVITGHINNEPHFLEFGIFNVSSGKLKDRLHAHTHIHGKFDQPRTFSLGGIYRNPSFDEAAFDAHIAKIPSKLQYNPLKIKQNIINCEGGTCVTFMDDLIRNSSKVPRKGFHFLPEQLAKSLTEVVAPVRDYKRMTSSVGLGLAGFGAAKLYQAKDTEDTLVGAGALTAGLAAQLPGVKEVSNFGTGALTNAVGVTILKRTEKLLKGNLSEAMMRPGIKKGIGTAALLASGALAHGIYKKMKEK